MHRSEGAGRRLLTNVLGGSITAVEGAPISGRRSGHRRLRTLRLVFGSCGLVLVLALGVITQPAVAAPEAPETGEATEIGSTNAVLSGGLNPGAAGEAGTYQFQYGPKPTSCEESEIETPLTSDLGDKQEPASATVEGLSPATTYTFCLVAANPEGFERTLGSVKTFTTLAAEPTVAGQALLIVTPTTALLSAEIGPGGLSTAYYVEYVSQVQFEAHGWSEAEREPSEPGELPAAKAPVLVSEELHGLQSNTHYRFRFVGTNSLGTGVGTEDTFVTAAAAAPATLPDERAYELVSALGSGEPYDPPTPLGERKEATGFKTGLPFRAGAGGDAVAYVAEPGVSSGTGETGPGEGNQWLAQRAPSGWQTEDITPAENSTATYEAFSDDLATAFYEGDTTPLTAQVEPGCAALYARASDGGAFSALFTHGETPENCGHPLFAGAAADESQVYFQSEAALTAEASEAELPPGRGEHRANPNIGEGCQFGCNLYESAPGGLQLVNVLEGHAVPSATFGGYNPNESELPNLSNAISADGSRVFWTDTQSGPDFEHVYVRENGTSTVQVSGTGPAEYWAASADGRYALYTEAGGLWRFDTQANTREQVVEDAAEVQGVIGTNQKGEEGAYLYFVANGALAEAQPNAQGEHPEPGNCPAPTEGPPSGWHLYLLHEGVTSFIARLSGRDNALQSVTVGFNEKGGDWTTGLGERTAELTPDGQHLIFESVEGLTGYKNGVSLPEPGVFVYAADSSALACVSCSPTGAAPTQPLEEEVKLASKLPVSREAKTYMHRWISEDGARVFFDSSQPLAPHDTNGVQDVYEWERPAEPGEADNSCTTEEASPVTGGCTFLLSSGTGTSDSFL